MLRKLLARLRIVEKRATAKLELIPEMNTELLMLEISRAELLRSYQLSEYEAVDVAWVALIKVANTRNEPTENGRLLALFGTVEISAVSRVLQNTGIDALLELDPPLETILTGPHEQLNAQRTAGELLTIRQQRTTNPEAALLALIAILKRIRNRRAHGFKTPYSTERDRVILGLAAQIIQALGEIAIHAAGTNRPLNF